MPRVRARGRQGSHPVVAVTWGSTAAAARRWARRGWSRATGARHGSCRCPTCLRGSVRGRDRGRSSATTLWVPRTVSRHAPCTYSPMEAAEPISPQRRTVAPERGEWRQRGGSCWNRSFQKAVRPRSHQTGACAGLCATGGGDRGGGGGVAVKALTGPGLCGGPVEVGSHAGHGVADCGWRSCAPWRQATRTRVLRRSGPATDRRRGRPVGCSAPW
jgi:hypothetical protein